jgi:hypothetical protein
MKVEVKSIDSHKGFAQRSGMALFEKTDVYTESHTAWIVGLDNPAFSATVNSEELGRDVRVGDVFYLRFDRAKAEKTV